MELHIVIHGDRDLSEQVYRQLGDAIRAGRLADGQQIPPSRLLAQQLGVSRKTVSDAYARLTYDKLLVGRIGKGSFVSAPPPAPRPGGAAPAPAGGALAGNPQLRRWNAVAMPLRHPQADGRSRFDFIGGCVSPAHFPQEEWRRCVQHALRRDGEGRGRYAQPEGMAVLREAIAHHAAFARGVVCTPAQVLVTNGAQQAFDLLGRILVEPGSTVAVEEPGYPPVRLLLAGQGARVVGVPVDAEGLVVEAIPDDARLIYVTPAHQFPLGMPMSVARRQALLARAKAIGALIIEDDYDSEFRYEGRPTDSLQSMDRDGIVAFVGSFSKVLLPELRLGYVIAPEPVLAALRTAKHLSDWHTAGTAQLTLAKFIGDGYLQKHIRRCHGIYASRREQLQAGFTSELAPWFDLVPASAGFHVAALARPSVAIDIALLLRLARRADVGLYDLGAFYHGAEKEKGLFLGYGAIETLDIGPALVRLRDILTEMSRA